MARTLLRAALMIALLALSNRGSDRVRATTLPEAVEVVKPYGAALRGEPSSDAGIAHVASCGEWLTVAGEQDGWYLVYSRAAYYWVGGARVADVLERVAYTCEPGFTFQPQDVVQAIVASGCLSVRAFPGASAPYDHCVASYHRFLVTNGPIEEDGEDWFEVWSEVTGRGWARAQYLFPVD